MDNQQTASSVPINKESSVPTYKSGYGLLIRISLFTFIVGIILKLSAKPFELPVLSIISNTLFLVAFICLATKILIYIISALFGYSLFTKSLIISISSGVLLTIGYQIYPIIELKSSIMISFGIAILTIIIKIFQLIFLS